MKDFSERDLSHIKYGYRVPETFTQDLFYLLKDDDKYSSGLYLLKDPIEKIHTNIDSFSGSWTPIVIGTERSPEVEKWSYNTGRFNKYGNQVLLSFNVVAQSEHIIDYGEGDIIISNIPFKLFFGADIEPFINMGYFCNGAMVENGKYRWGVSGFNQLTALGINGETNPQLSGNKLDLIFNGHGILEILP
jgi:hypothetical protein